LQACRPDDSHSPSQFGRVADPIGSGWWWRTFKFMGNSGEFLSNELIAN